MSGSGSGYFDVGLDELARVAGRLGEVTEALGAAVDASGELRAVAGTNAGFTTVGAALDVASAWVDEVRRLGGQVDAARTGIGDSVSAYARTDGDARGRFAGLGG